MSKTPVLAALSAALLAIDVPTYGTEGVIQRIKDDQYSNFVSGASFCTGVWTNANETWSASGGLNPRYWYGTSGASVVDVGGRAPDGSYYSDSYGRWRQMHQPPVYGRVVDYQKYQPLYSWGNVAGRRDFLVDIATPTAAPVVCRFAEEGDVVATDGHDIFFDANVTLEVFAYGEANRPDASVLAPDAKLALYMQHTRPGGYPGFFIVARDWNTGAARHYRVEDDYRWMHRYNSYSGNRFSGRIIVRAVKSTHNGESDTVVPAFLVYLIDGTAPLRVNSNHLFRSLSTTSDMRLSKVSYSGGVRLGAYAVGTADPMYTTVRWAADSSMIRLLSVGSRGIDGVYRVPSTYDLQYQGAEKVDAGAYTYYYNLDYPQESVSWRGVNGWSDGSYIITPGGGCEIVLGTNCFSAGRASIDSFEEYEDIDEGVAELEADGLPHVASRVPGTGRYTEVTDALVHAAHLGATVKLLADPTVPLVMPPLKSDVTVDLNGHPVPADRYYAISAGLSTGNYDDFFDYAKPHGGVVAYPAPGKECTFTLTDSSSSASGERTPVFGGLSVTGVSLRVSGVEIKDFSQICNSPSAIVSGAFYGGLYVTNTALSVTGSIQADTYYTTVPEFMTGIDLRVDGGSLSVSDGFAGDVVGYGVNPVSITSEAELGSLTLYDSAVTALAGDILEDVSISNSPTGFTMTGDIGGGVTLTDIHGDVDVYTYLGPVDITRAGAVTIRKEAWRGGSMVVRDSSSVVVETDIGPIRIYDTPVIELRDGGHDLYWPDRAGTLEMHRCGSVLLSGYSVAPTPTYPKKISTSTVTLSDCTFVTVTAGDFFGYKQHEDPRDGRFSNGRFSVSGDSLVVSGGRFYSMDAREASSVTVSNSPTFYGSASFSAPSVKIRGGTFCVKPYPGTSAYWPEAPTFSIVSTNAVISGGTFNGTLSGSGIVVSGGKFIWGKNEHLDKNGVIVLAEGKKLVKTGPASSINSSEWDLRNTYWEVRNK